MATIRQECHALKKCCPAARICLDKLKESSKTRALREKHVEINEKTLACREINNQIEDNHKRR